MISKERKNEILNLMIDWLDYHDLNDCVDDVLTEKDDLDEALSTAINHIDEHIHDMKDKEIAWRDVIGLTNEEMDELDISNIHDYLNVSENGTDVEVYKNEEEDEDTLTTKNGKLIDTSVGEIINFGEVSGFVKIQNTTYLIIKDGNSLYAYSIDTGFPYKFNK